MTLVTLVEIAAAVTTVTAFVPQALKILKTRNTKDLSTTTWVMQVIGFSLWLTYGIASANWPIVLPNVLTLMFSIVILALKLSSRSNG